MKFCDALEKTCPIFLSAITIARMCDTGMMSVEDSEGDDRSSCCRNGLLPLINVYEKRGRRGISWHAGCQPDCCAMWVWDDEESEEGHCGLIHK